MATVVINGEAQEWDDSDPRVSAYDALDVAAHKIGRAGYNTGDEIKSLQRAMGDVLAGKITPEQAMSLLHYDDTGYALEQARKSAKKVKK